MLSTKLNGPWIIGGSGRSGKTTLVNLIEESNNQTIGFPLELLINVYDEEYTPNFVKNKQYLCEEYISRTRYLDVERKERKSLLDLIKSEKNKKKFQNVPKSVSNSIQLIDWIITTYANVMNCENWAAFDLHPEFKYEKYNQFINNLNMVIMIRDPREVIAEIMFWRGKPVNKNLRKRKFYHSFISWLLSIKTSIRLIKKYPDRVKVIFFNKLVNQDIKECEILHSIFNISNEQIKKTYKNIYYNYDLREGHLLPSGARKQLLSRDELLIIEKISTPIFKEIKYNFSKSNMPKKIKLHHFLAEKIILFLICINNHALSRSINDMIFFPKRFINRKYANIKKIIRANYLFR